MSDTFIPFSRKVVVDLEHKAAIMRIIDTEDVVLEYDHGLHIFSAAFDFQKELENMQISYSLENKNLNDVYNYLIIRNEIS